MHLLYTRFYLKPKFVFFSFYWRCRGMWWSLWFIHKISWYVKKFQQFLQWKEHGCTHMMMLMLMMCCTRVRECSLFINLFIFWFFFLLFRTSNNGSGSAAAVVVAMVTALCSDRNQMSKQMPSYARICTFADTRSFVHVINSKVVCVHNTSIWHF